MATNPKMKPVCPYCGSANVTHDAIVRWNIETQDWSMSSMLDSGDCDDCGEESNEFNMIPVNEAGQ